MTRAEMIAIIKAVDDKEFKDEIDFHLCLDREYGDNYDEVSALFDVEDRAEMWGTEAATPDQRKAARRLLKIARRVLIDIGFYRVMPQDEIDNTFTSSGRAPWSFKLDGVAYTTDETTEEWQFPNP